MSKLAVFIFEEGQVTYDETVIISWVEQKDQWKKISKDIQNVTEILQILYNQHDEILQPQR